MHHDRNLKPVFLQSCNPPRAPPPLALRVPCMGRAAVNTIFRQYASLQWLLVPMHSRAAPVDAHCLALAAPVRPRSLALGPPRPRTFPRGTARAHDDASAATAARTVARRALVKSSPCHALLRLLSSACPPTTLVCGSQVRRGAMPLAPRCLAQRTVAGVVPCRTCARQKVPFRGSEVQRLACMKIRALMTIHRTSLWLVLRGRLAAGGRTLSTGGRRLRQRCGIARGAEQARTAARACRGRLLLLSPSPPPGPEPAKVCFITNDALRL
mmetsp:Transcript_20632/g.66819  ORF Transcript_20632/g.66819 Transcript_20632/m.66819 type:complete len:269 (-) Transcript_20632:86-892(-)